MSIWKDLTNSASFGGHDDTGVDLPAPAHPPARPAAPPAQIGKIASVIGPGIVIEGKIDGDGDIRIGGCVKGDVRVQGKLVIDSGAQILGIVEAAEIILGGEVEGNVLASGQVELLKTGRLIGDLKAKFLTAALGSHLRGKVEFGSDQSAVRSADGKRLSGENDAQAHAAPTAGL
jgi:cytoskeletal protein CcmA (bactofilin family)